MAEKLLPSEVLSDKQLLKLAEQLNDRCDWENVATYLGFSLAKIQQMKTKERAAFEMLVDWRRNKGVLTWEHVNQLAEALKQCRKYSLAEKLKNGTLHLSHHSPIDLHKIRQDLRKTYCHRHDKIKKYPWSNREHLSIKKIFTSLLIHVMLPDCNQTIKIPLDSYQDMFSRTSDIGERYRRILIEGKPGCGKSTLLDKIAYDWATNTDSESTLGKIDLLFYLKMRWFDSDTNIEDAIMKQLLAHDDEIDPDELLKFITDMSSALNICVILDGYDECNHVTLSDDANKVTNIPSILQNTKLKDCIVVVTTRPEKTQDFGEYLEDYYVFEVAGFTKENMEAYVKKYMNKEEHANDVLKFVENAGLRQELATMPLVIHLLCLYWEKRTTKSELLSNPSTMFEIYEAIHRFINEHYLKRIKLQGRDLLTREKEIKKLIHKLGKLALDGLLVPQRNSVWTLEELQTHLDDSEIQEACEVGIITQDDKLDNESSSLRKVTCFEFFHKTSQELHAGKYLGSFSAEMAKACLTEHVKTVGDALKLQMLFLFGCGSNITIAEVIIKHLSDLFVHELRPKIHQYYRGELEFEETRNFQMFYDLCLQCNFESKADGKFIQILLKLFPDKTMVFYGMVFQTAIGIEYLLNNTTDRGCISTLKVVGVPRRGRVISITESANTLVDKEYKTLRDKVGRQSLAECQDLLRGEPSLQHIAEEGGATKAIVNAQLWQKFEHWQGGLAIVKPLVDGIVHVDLNTLNLRQVAIGNRSATLFSRMKEGLFTTLTVLNLRDTGLQDTDLLKFVDAMDNLKMLNSLDISYNNIGSSLTKLSNKLKRHQTHGILLRRLDIRDSHISAEILTTFWSNFADFCGKLEEVYTHGASNITNANGMRFLVENIPKSPNLGAVTFSAAGVADSIHLISKFLTAISTTSVWNIAIYEIPLAATDFITILREGLPMCSNLKWVMLGCKYGNQGDVVPKDVFQGLVEVLRSLKLLTRFGLKDIPLDKECLTMVLDLTKSNNYKELMYSKRCLPQDFDIPKDNCLWLV
ncbi:uncharacterized protein [Amphiura filiformis]|uniref:uncharacterized protein n=1 Tax=Amphiura filiformis TaxID=82378 RepID=UPI003B220F57